MSFPDALKSCFRKYVTFSGRAGRSEFWFFALFIIVTGWVLDFVEHTIGLSTVLGPGALGVLFSFATLPPLLAVGWRRMHDSGRSGLHLIYPLIVMIGISTFVGLLSGFQPIMAGDYGQMINNASGIVVFAALGVFMISPLLVLWWLAAPTQPRENRYGPVPTGG